MKNEELIALCIELIYQNRKIEVGSNNSDCLIQINKSDVLNIDSASKKSTHYLNNLYRNSKEAIHSYGSSILYLTIGFLERENLAKSPIALIPVELKKSISGKFSLEWTGEDPFTSLALQKDMDYILPDFPLFYDKDDVNSYISKLELYFENIVDAVRTTSWKIHQDVALDLFSNKKYQMYLDLDPEAWGDKMQNHPILQELYSISSGNEPQIFSDNLELQKTYRVFADDLSHIEAIEAVKSGKNLLIDGGPGTGKSQTIVGMITELMGAGKKVLFVSDKQAAIDVVYRRLDKELNLGNFCFVLHNDKLKKGDIFNDIMVSWKTAEDIKKSGNPEFGEEQLGLFKKKSKILDNYVSELSKIRCKRNLTAYDLFGINEKTRQYFQKRKIKMPDLNLSTPENWTSEDWTKAIFALEKLTDFSDIYASNTVWNGCNPGLVGQKDISDIGKQIDACLELYHKLQDYLDRICRVCSLKSISTMEDIDNKINPGMKLVLESQHFAVSQNPHIIMLLKSGDWQSLNKKIIPLLKQSNSLKAQIMGLFDESIFELNSDAISKYANANVLQKTLNPDFSDFITEVRGHCTKNVSDNVLMSKLKLLDQFENIKKELEAEENIEKFLNPYWNIEKSNIQQIEKFVLWADSFQKAYKNGNIFSENIFDTIGFNQSSSPKTSQSKPFVNLKIEDMNELVLEFNQSLDSLFEKLGTNSISLFGEDKIFVQANSIKGRLDEWSKNLSSLSSRGQILACKNMCLETVAKDMIPFLDSKPLLLQDSLAMFEGNYAKIILNSVIKDDTLSKITSNCYSKAREDFIEIEDSILKYNVSRLAYELCAGIKYSSQSMAGLNTPENLLRSNKQSIYNLIDNAGDFVQAIKPCFMMSPTAVAQYLPRSTCFDVVIFDEASQLKNVDAMGSILRAKQLVVCGDINQMPPSNYFEKIIENPGYVFDDNIVSLTNVESILEMANTKMENRTLNWHYRSKHESLIALPNEAIYDNRFYVHPSPNFDAKNQGLDFVLFEEGIYLSGENNSTNPLEAKKIVKDAFSYHFENPSKTIGIASFSRAQMEMIQKEVDLLLNDYPEESFFFNSPDLFFVKNLENVQGDERDAIFLSICYGYNQYGKFIQNFGTISKEGGDKKLNVFITRAKEKCSVYANFRFNDIKVSETTSAGVKLLKSFIEYADKRKLKSINEGCSAKVSDFANCICNFLNKNGYSVRTNYGVGKYYIDIVVEDPVRKGQFLAAILLDGPQYYNTENIRDRIRTHHEVLKSMGWNLYYILSPEWYNCADKAEKELISYLDNISRVSKERYNDDLQISNLESESSCIADDYAITPDVIGVDDTCHTIENEDSVVLIEKLEPLEIIENDSTIDNTVENYVCHNCGKLFDYDAKPNFCSHCGYKLDK